MINANELIVQDSCWLMEVDGCPNFAEGELYLCRMSCNSTRTGLKIIKGVGKSRRQ
jgi:hypothetical protein